MQKREVITTCMYQSDKCVFHILKLCLRIPDVAIATVSDIHRNVWII